METLVPSLQLVLLAFLRDWSSYTFLLNLVYQNVSNIIRSSLSIEFFINSWKDVLRIEFPILPAQFGPEKFTTQLHWPFSVPDFLQIPLLLQSSGSMHSPPPTIERINLFKRISLPLLPLKTRISLKIDKSSAFETEE